MKVAMISDVHEQWNGIEIPECDLLISAGDYSYRGNSYIVSGFHKWLNAQPAKHIISVQGNHELWVEQDPEQARYIATTECPRLDFIIEGGVEIMGHKIWGSAVQPEFNDWAWNVRRGAPIKTHWDKIPDDTEILVTHGPAYGILDRSILRVARHTDESLGCEELLKRIKELKKLKLHVFGHIHGSSGETDIDGVHFVNAAICDEYYKPTNPVRVWEI